MILFSGGLRFGINFLQFIGDNYLIKNEEKKSDCSPASFEEKIRYRPLWTRYDQDFVSRAKKKQKGNLESLSA